MKLIVYYTDTHEKLYKDYFLESIKDDYGFKIIAKKGHQHSLNGSYFSQGFNETTRDKINFLLDNLLESKENEIVLFSDVDIIFLGDIKEYIKGYDSFDMVFQNGFGGLNTGFFIMKNNQKVRTLLESVINECHKFDNDQIATNEIIKRYDLNITMFDDKIMSPANLIGQKIWSGENLIIPSTILVFHACWCVGVENKSKLLEYVRTYKKS